MTLIQIHHLILAIVLLVIVVLMGFRFRSLKAQGNMVQIKPRTLIILSVLIVYGAFSFIHLHRALAVMLATFWLVPCLVMLAVAMLVTRSDPVQYDADKHSLSIPSGRRKLLVILISIYVIIYLSIAFFAPEMLQKPAFLYAYMAIKGVVAGLYLGMNVSYFRQYLALRKTRHTPVS